MGSIANVASSVAKSRAQGSPFLGTLRNILGTPEGAARFGGSSLSNTRQSSVANTGQQGARRPTNRRASLLNQR